MRMRSGSGRELTCSQQDLGSDVVGSSHEGVSETSLPAMFPPL